MRTKLDSYAYYNHWFDTCVDGLLVFDSIIRPVVNSSALTWLIRYIYYWNLQFLNNVIIIKTKVYLPREYTKCITLSELGYPV
jgi:hypothetical protein